MKIKKISINNLKKSLLSLGTEEQGAKIMSSKGQLHSFFIQKIATPAAHILKQEALSLGGDFALPRGAILYEENFYDGILLITQGQLALLCHKLKLQPFGLKTLANSLEQFLSIKNFEVQIMGIINLTPDSFFKDSRFNAQKAKEKILELIDLEVEMIDIGAASSRPGSQRIDPQEELKRVREVAEFIYSENLYNKVDFSIDTYNFEVADFCANRGFKVINDITGFCKEQMLEVARRYNSKCVLMHMQGEPLSMQENPQYSDVITDINDFFHNKIIQLHNNGIKDIILDIGVGFGKNLQHNCELIRNLGHFKHFNYPLLIGASRKSLINQLYPSQTEDRLAGTLAIHLYALNAGASILRVHDAKEHKQAIKVWQKLQENPEITRRNYGKS